MSNARRKRYSAEFKAMVVLEAIRGEQSCANWPYELRNPVLIGQFKSESVSSLLRILHLKKALI